MRLLSRQELEELVTMPEAIDAIEAAFLALADGRAVLPPPVGLDLPEVRGEVHVKGAHLQGSTTYTFKVASGFYRNPERGLPSGDGLMLVFDAITGQPRALLLDHAWLTDVRTGAAGGVAARWLAPPEVERAAILGAGVQARMQLRALLAVREVGEVRIWNRNPERARECAREMAAEHDVAVTAADTVGEAVADAAVIVTATPSREPLLDQECPSAGCHVTAVGSDGPGKRELSARLLRRADRLVVDRRSQSLALGELQQLEGEIEESSLVEIGEVVAGRVPGRQGPAELTVADLTGVGVQDAAIADLVLDRALKEGIGLDWSP